jgi:ribosomal protein S18 acetylase RimI-like enzyme
LLYVRRDHRNGVGRNLVRGVLADMQRRGVRRVVITPVTDLRVAKIWRRMGFKPVAELMTYTFPETA